jgi:hypothetical protein
MLDYSIKMITVLKASILLILSILILTIVIITILILLIIITHLVKFSTTMTRLTPKPHYLTYLSHQYNHQTSN